MHFRLFLAPWRPLRRSLQTTAFVTSTIVLSALGCRDATVHASHLYVVIPAGESAVLYGKVENETSIDDTLTALTVSVAGRAEMHETQHNSGSADTTSHDAIHQAHDMAGMSMSGNAMSSMTMRAVSHLPLAAGKSITFAPGGYHVMLFDVKPMKAGDSADVTMQLRHAGTITARAAIITYADVDTATAALR